jgi:hypothetical protein
MKTMALILQIQFLLAALFWQQQPPVSDTGSSLYYIAQFVPVLVMFLGIAATVVGVWSKKASDKNGCTLQILMEKFDAEIKRNQGNADLVKALKAQIDTLIAVAPVLTTVTTASTETSHSITETSQENR